MPAASQLHPNEQTFCDDGTRVLFVPIVLQKSENARYVACSSITSSTAA
jgi:hypothetical protein